MQIWLRRAYEKPGRQDGVRVLVDRLWPRGVSREQLQLDAWLKDLAPSSGLRRWFDHDPAKWSEFKHRYGAELEGCPEAGKALGELLNLARSGRLTLVYGAREMKYNNAEALKEYLEERLQRRES